MEQQGTFWLPPQASTTAHEIDAVFYFVLWTSTVIFVGVVGFMVYYAWKYRRRSKADRPIDVKPNKWLELSWVVIPTILVMVVFWWGMIGFLSAGIPPAHAYQINVYAAKWRWDFVYPNGKRSTGDLVVPVGHPVKLLMTSTDVIHSFFVPAFRVKKDVVPNRYTSVWFEVKEPGEYQVFCAEFCGRLHAEMYARVIALPPAEFNAWVREIEDPDVPLVEFGEMLFAQQGCQACHSIDGTSLIGPTVYRTWGQPRPQTDGTRPIMDADYVIESIVNPMARITEGYQPVMPPYPHLTERQLQALVAYIMHINNVWVEEIEEEMVDDQAPVVGEDGG